MVNQEHMFKCKLKALKMNGKVKKRRRNKRIKRENRILAIFNKSHLNLNKNNVIQYLKELVYASKYSISGAKQI